MIRRLSAHIPHIFLGLAAAATLLLASVAHSGTVQAAAPAKTSGGGITVSPAFQQVVVSQDQPSKSFNFSVTNHTSETYEFSLSTIDFGSLDENGGVLFMGQSDQSLNYKYGLSQWVTLGQDRIVVDPGKTVKVPITIDNKKSLAPGGHYGAILLSPASTPNRPTKVQINQVMSSLVFLTKEGGVIYDMRLHDYSANTHLFSMPGTVKLRFQNAGNVHVIPQGVAYVTDPRGRMVKQGFINPGSAIILPETFRQLPIKMDTTGVAWLPGRYHLHIAYRYQGQSTSQTRDISFIYVNGWYVVALLVLIALILGMILSKWVRRIVLAPFRFIKRVFRKLVRRMLRRRQKAV